MSSSVSGVELVPYIVWERRFGGVRIHNEEDCAALWSDQHCPFDKPSDHKMVSWPLLIRVDRGGLCERLCEHGVGHPDPDSEAFLYEISPSGAWGVHGCDGCCVDTTDQHFIAG